MSQIKEGYAEETIDEFGFQDKIYNSQEIFQRLKQYDPLGISLDTEKIKLFAVSTHQIVIVTDQNKVYRLREELDEKFINYPVPEKKVDNPNKEFKEKIKDMGKQILFLGAQGPKVSIDRIFLDPNGYHCILTCDSGCSFYLNYDHNKIKFLKNLKGSEFVIKSIGWDETCTNTTTKNILFGTQEGMLYIYKIEIGKNNEIIDCNPEKTLALKGGRSVLQINYLRLGSEENSRIVILVSTSTSIFTFHGTEFNLMFQKFRTIESQEQAELKFPNITLTSVMSVCYTQKEDTGKYEPHSFIWTNGVALQVFDIPQDASSLQETKYYKYAKNSDEPSNDEYKVKEMPIDIFLSEFHYFLLHSDQLTILSRINEKIVQKFDLKFMGIVYGMSFDYSSQSLWIYSSKQIFKLSIKNEGTDAWRLLLEKKMIKQAYEISMRNGQDATEYLGGLYADSLLEAKQYQEAANQYFQTSRSFEEITLKFLNLQMKGDMESVDGLEVYLMLWLNNLNSEAKAQRIMIINWLIELKVSRYNYFIQQVTKNKIHRPKDQHGTEWIKYQDYKKWERSLNFQDQNIEQFLVQYCDDIPEESIYQIMQSHGRLKECIQFAKQRKTYEMIVQHYINEEQFDNVIEVFKGINKPKKLAQLLQKYCHILLQKYAPDTIDLMKKSIELLRKYKFRTEKLVIGIMNVPEKHKKDAISFVQLLVENNYKEKTIHNLYIYLLCDKNYKSELNKHLAQQQKKIMNEEKINFDIDFALRLTSQKMLRNAQIQIYGMMDLYQEAIDLALNQELIEAAISFARKPYFKDDKKKKMWLKIAKHLLNKGGNNVQEVIKMINDEQQFIKIEDLLTQFSENVKIEHFKDQICNCLQNYNTEIKELKQVIKQYSDSADKLQIDLKLIKNRYVEMNQNVTCMECVQSLFNESFYIFPCMHGFHKACLIQRMKKDNIDQGKINQIEQLNQEIEVLQQKQLKIEVRKRQSGSGFFNNINQIFSAARGGSEEIEINQQQMSINEERELQEQKQRIDQLLANECIFCGPGVVDNIFMKYEKDRDPKTSWEL
ncbi:hypothetical protein ABPG74_002353 [Tetrahymena malaccensis]